MKTYRAVFGEDIAILRMQPGHKLDARQNLLLVMGDAASVQRARELGYEVVDVPKGGSLLTDDYAPIEQLIQASGEL